MMGRPPLSLDMHKIFQLSHSHTQREIGAMFGVAHTTISRRLKKYRPVKRTPKQCVIIGRLPSSNIKLPHLPPEGLPVWGQVA